MPLPAFLADSTRTVRCSAVQCSAVQCGDQAHLPCDIAVVAGRNAELARRLRARTWQRTTHVYDFVSNFAAASQRALRIAAA